MKNPVPEPEHPAHPPHQGMLFRSKRLELQISQTELAAFLGVSFMTIHNWETSPRGKCRQDLKPLRENFLLGRYDQKIRAIRHAAGQIRLPPPEKRLLEKLKLRIKCVHTLCIRRPDLQEKLLLDIMTAITRILADKEKML